MSGKRLRSNSQPTECMGSMSVQRFKLGDIIWCKVNGDSWWPAQVVDENCVAFKPKRKKKDQILVRLYGTFDHMYVQRTNCVSKTEKICEEGNLSSREIFEKVLEEDLDRMKSGWQPEARVSESIENGETKDEASRGKVKRKGNSKRAMIEENSPLVDSSDNPKVAKKVKIVVRALRSGTRSETFEAGNDKKSGTEDAVTIHSLDKKDASCEQNLDAYTPEILDAKGIKRLVTKIVREVAAENARNEALKIKGMGNCPGKTESVETSKKYFQKMKNLQLHIPRRVKNRDMGVRIAGDIDDTQGINDMHVYQRTKSNDPPMEMEMLKHIEPDAALNGDERDKSFKDVLGEQMFGAGTRSPSIPEEVDELSPRRARIMQNLGLIAPSGSPFSRNGLIPTF